MNLIENKDYELIPKDVEGWDIRILKGDYVETVISFSTLKLDEVTESIRFSFDIVSSPNTELTVDNNQFNRYVGGILGNILEIGTTNDTNGSHKPRANDTQELIN